MASQVDPYPTAPAGRSGTLATVREALSRPVVLALFLVCATQPYGIEFGSLLVGPYRLILALIGPILVIQWLMGRFGKLLWPDFLILGHALWIFAALAANGQSSRLVEWGGAQFIDIFFAYLLGRAAIRNKRDFYFFTKVLLWVLLFLLPFAILESTRGMVILITLAERVPFFDAFGIVTLQYPPRLGLLRAQTGSVHPILYGILCSMGFSFGLLGLAYSPKRPGLGKRALMTLGTYVGTFFSLSSGAFAAVGVQGFLMLWNWFLRSWRARWRVLAGAVALMYMLISFVSDRPPALVLGRLISFSGSTSFNRYQIWQFGSAEVGRHPIFGMGIFSDWQRAQWMSASIDNQWLQQAMRFGLVGVGLLLAAYAYILYRLIRIDFGQNKEMGAIRDAFVFTFIALLIAYGTVAAWHIQWSLLMLLLGGSTWIFTTPPEDAAASDQADDDGDQGRHGGPRYTRNRTAAPQPGRPSSQAQPSQDRPSEAPTYSRFPPPSQKDPGDR